MVMVSSATGVVRVVMVNGGGIWTWRSLIRRTCGSSTDA